jgi:hypothetical protein
MALCRQGECPSLTPAAFCKPANILPIIQTNDRARIARFWALQSTVSDLHSFIYRSDWPGGWGSCFRLLDRRPFVRLNPHVACDILIPRRTITAIDSTCPSRPPHRSSPHEQRDSLFRSHKFRDPPFGPDDPAFACRGECDAVVILPVERFPRRAVVHREVGA